MQIFIKSFDDKTLTLEVELTDSIDKIKLELQEKTGMNVNNMRLIFAGKQLNSGILGDYNVEKEFTIHLVGRLMAD